MDSPYTIFDVWYNEEMRESRSPVPSACCLSTIGADGFPNARFVALKAVHEGKFIITGPLDSRKFIELKQNNHAALTFWWEATQKQVRIQGFASPAPDSLADIYFSERDRESRLAALASHQGEPITDPDMLTIRLNELLIEYGEKDITRPANWGGVGIEPHRMELLEFRSNRLHHRTLFTKSGSFWLKTFLQP